MRDSALKRWPMGQAGVSNKLVGEELMRDSALKLPS